MRKKIVRNIRDMNYYQGFIIKTFFPIEFVCLIIGLFFLEVSLFNSVVFLIWLLFAELLTFFLCDSFGEFQEFDSLLFGFDFVLTVIANFLLILPLAGITGSFPVLYLFCLSSVIFLGYRLVVQYIFNKKPVKCEWNSIYLHYMLRNAKKVYKSQRKEKFLSVETIKNLVLINYSGVCQLLKPNVVINISEENMEKLSTLSLTFNSLEKNASSYKNDMKELRSLFDLVLSSIEEDIEVSEELTKKEVIDSLKVENNKEQLDYAKRQIKGL